MTRKSEKRRGQSLFKGVTDDEFLPINDNIWTCSVALLMEKNNESKKFIKSFEDGSENGWRPVIKNLTFSFVDSLLSKMKDKSKTGTRASMNKKTPKMDSIQTEGKTKLLADCIVRLIQQWKSEDVANINNRFRELELCEPHEKKKSTLNDTEGIQDEPLCGPSLYVVLTGFYDPQIIVELLKLQVPLEVIMAFNETRTDDAKPAINKLNKIVSSDLKGKQLCDNFWTGYEEIVKAKENRELMNNLILLTYDPKELLVGRENVKSKDLNILVYDYVIMRLFDLQIDRRRHGHFVRNMKLIKINDVKRASYDDLKFYRDLVGSVPIDMITIDRILFCLVEAVLENQNTYSTFDLRSDLKSEGSMEEIETEKSQEEIELKYSDISEDSVRWECNEEKDISPFVVDHKNSRKLAMKNFQHYYLQFSDYYIKILEKSICPSIWQYYPPPDDKDKLFTLSHYQKVLSFLEVGDKVMLEVSLLKRIFIKLLLSVIDTRNVDAVCRDTFDHYCSCAMVANACEEEQGESVHYGKITSEGIISDINFYTRFAKENDLSICGDETNKEDTEETLKIKELIVKNNNDLINLKNFLKFPELDDLIVDGFHALENYSVIEVYSKETALHLANRYSGIYEFVDCVHYSPTDCLIFVYHNDIDEDGFSQQFSENHLLTPTGYRDYRYHLSDKYRLWMKKQDKIIESENEVILRKHKVTTGQEDEERCCFLKIKKFGLFPERKEQKPSRLGHAPHPSLDHVIDNEGELAFTAYDMNTKQIFRCTDSHKTFISESESKIMCKTYNNFHPLKQINCISFKNSIISIFYEFDPASSHTTKKIQLETTDGTRIVFKNRKSNKIEFNSQRERSLDDKIIKKPVSTTELREEKKEAEQTKDNNDHKMNDFIIVLPNGLEITIYTLDDEILGVKQRHLEPTSRMADNKEAYRICLKGGTVICYMTDGTIKVYYANSTISDIKWVASEKHFADVCGTELKTEIVEDENDKVNPKNMGQKPLPQTKRQSKDQENQANNVINQNIYYVIGEHNVLTWSGAMKHYKFNFCTDTKREHQLRLAYEEGTELFTSRSDGTKSLLNVDGELVVHYPDGTRITTNPYYYLLSYDKSSQDFQRVELDDGYDDDLWVYIEFDFLMEEPKNYVPVKYSRDKWTILLPGSKRVCFSDNCRMEVHLGRGELSFNREKGIFHLSCTDSATSIFSTLTINLWPEEDDPVCTFYDESNLVTVDKSGHFSRSDYTQTVETSYGFFRMGQTFDRISGSSSQTNDDSISYIIKPSKKQKDFKLLFLRRDLTGGELISDEEQDRTCGGTSIYTDIEHAGTSNKQSYRDGQCVVMLWNMVPLGEQGLYSAFCKVPYSDPYCFASSRLQRFNLTHYIPPHFIWLLTEMNPTVRDYSSFSYTPESFRDYRTSSTVTNYRASGVFALPSENWENDFWQPRDSGSSSASFKLIDTSFLPKNRPVMIVRRAIDLKNVEDLDQTLQNALALYMDYKKKIYTTILKNSIEEIKIKQNPVKDQREGTYRTYAY